MTSTYAAHERAEVQGAADFAMVASGATAGVLSGVIVDATSYHFLSHWAAVAALGLVAAALYPGGQQAASVAHAERADVALGPRPTLITGRSPRVRPGGERPIEGQRGRLGVM